MHGKLREEEAHIKGFLCHHFGLLAEFNKLLDFSAPPLDKNGALRVDVRKEVRTRIEQPNQIVHASFQGTTARTFCLMMPEIIVQLFTYDRFCSYYTTFTSVQNLIQSMIQWRRQRIGSYNYALLNNTFTRNFGSRVPDVVPLSNDVRKYLTDTLE
eukprot:TRINITY_DN2826_c0_g2_i12.p1 TRINITY_DN2826_c0_g2~~TRINITY_DN2826_c0_g2_i12.p1  ORF type:complete len:156 (-),score=1.41 TRINITY_DN2826_c0_g2_i12:81-548(-)